jgi:hypothetical protein
LEPAIIEESVFGKLRHHPSLISARRPAEQGLKNYKERAETADEPFAVLK